MKHITKQELLLYRKIKKQKCLIDESIALQKAIGFNPIYDCKSNMNNIVKLANRVNEFEEIGEVETYEQLNENARFIKWYNTINEYLLIKKGIFNE